MLVHGNTTEVVKFKSLEELMKLNQTHYILKYALGDELAVYYVVIDSANFILILYTIDDNAKSLHVKTDKGKVVECTMSCPGSKLVVDVESDSLLEATLDAVYGKKSKK